MIKFRILKITISLLMSLLTMFSYAQDTPDQKNYTRKVKPKPEQSVKSKNYSGNRKDDLKERNDNRKSTTRKTAAYSGSGDREGQVNKRNKISQQSANNQGNVKSGTLEDREANRKGKQKEIADNKGTVGGNYLENREDMRKDKDKENNNYKGSVGGDYLANRDKMRKEKAQANSNYKGDIGGNYLANRAKLRESNNKKASGNRGDIGGNFLANRANFRKNQNKRASGYSGDISVRTLQARNKNIRNKTHEMATYEGDIIVKGRKKGQHPSAVYRGGKIKNSYAAKEKYRKRMLKKYSKHSDVERPEEKKETKPRYDSKEADIWNK